MNAVDSSAAVFDVDQQVGGDLRHDRIDDAAEQRRREDDQEDDFQDGRDGVLALIADQGRSNAPCGPIMPRTAWPMQVRQLQQRFVQSPYPMIACGRKRDVFLVIGLASSRTESPQGAGGDPGAEHRVVAVELRQRRQSPAARTLRRRRGRRPDRPRCRRRSTRRWRPRANRAACAHRTRRARPPSRHRRNRPAADWDGAETSPTAAAGCPCSTGSPSTAARRIASARRAATGRTPRASSIPRDRA